MSTQDNTSIAAIVIAVIAFFVTVGQLLQAIFGTAEGYRNCQASVIGEWVIHTKRKWRWREFRFETRFKTPKILLMDVPTPDPTQETKEEFLGSIRKTCAKEDFLIGTHGSRRKTCVSLIQGSDVNSDLVGWLRLLDQLHRYTPSCVPTDVNAIAYGLAMFKGTTLPAITVREHSWDFTPPEITRPFATSNVGDIIALAHRLGMFWTDLRPADGIMRAEGNGSSIISTTIRGFGLLLQFTHDEAAERPESDPKKPPPEKKNLVPTAAADKLGFQIIPGDHCLGRIQEDGTRIGLPDFAFDERNRSKKVRDALKQLSLEVVENEYCNYMERHGNYIGFSDLLPLVAPFMSFWPSLNPKIIAPHASVDDSPFRCREGFFVFGNRSRPLSGPETRSTQIIWVHENFNRMEDNYGPMWTEGDFSMDTQHAAFDGFVKELQKIWDETTDYLDMLEREPRKPQKRFDYLDLVGSQMLQSVTYPNVWEEVRIPDILQTEGLPSHWNPRLCFAMQTYTDHVQNVVKEMERRGFNDFNRQPGMRTASEIVTDAWWTMALRAMCWHRAVSFVSGPTPGEVFAAPSQFYGSKIPLMIA